MRSQTKYLVAFFGVLVPLAVLVVVFKIWSSPAAGVETALGAVGPGEILVTNGAEERQRVQYRIGRTVTRGAPAVGLFGSHAMKRLSAEDLGLGPDAYMNYFVMHIGLPGIGDLLRHLEAADALPRDLILVHLHHPHSANWDHIVNRLWDLPVSTYLLHADMRPTNRLRAVVKMAGARIQETLDVRFFLNHVLNGPPFGCDRIDGVVTVEAARERSAARAAAAGDGRLSALLSGLGLMSTEPRVFQAACGPLAGLRSDGSVLVADSGSNPAPERRTMAPAHNPLPPGTEREIGRLMRRIADIGARNGRRVVFFAPPLYEVEHETPGMRMLDAAIDLARRDGLTVLDHRDWCGDRDLFVSSLQPNARYLERLLRAAGMDLNSRSGADR